MRALRQGDWVLLDEINLATAETLECLSGLLESSAGSVLLLERGWVLENKTVQSPLFHCDAENYMKSSGRGGDSEV